MGWSLRDIKSMSVRERRHWSAVITIMVENARRRPMTTPSPQDFGGTAAGSRLLGANDLQAALDSLTTAVKAANTSAVQASSSQSPGGTPAPFGSTGQSFTFGSFPKMSSAAPSNSGPGGYSGSNVTAPSPLGGGHGQPGRHPSSQQRAARQAWPATAMAGGSQFSTQILMNQMASQSTLGMGPGNVGQQAAADVQQAFGTYGHPAGLNAIALNPADAGPDVLQPPGHRGQPERQLNSPGPRWLRRHRRLRVRQPGARRGRVVGCSCPALQPADVAC